MNPSRPKTEPPQATRLRKGIFGGSLFGALVGMALFSGVVRGAQLKPYSGAGCAAVDDFFVDEVWAKVAAESCLKCHKAWRGVVTYLLRQHEFLYE